MAAHDGDGLHEELIAAISEWNPLLSGALNRDSPLITSSRLDSLGLMKLLVWIEGQVGRQIDVSAIDLAREWDTVDAVVSYVERARRAS